MTTSLVKFDISDIKRSIISHHNFYPALYRGNLQDFSLLGSMWSPVLVGLSQATVKAFAKAV